MEDKNRQVLEVAITGEQKAHLQRYLSDYTIKESDYNVEFSASKQAKTPLLFRCTKEHKAWKISHAQWRQRRERTRCFLRCIGGTEMVHLKTYLGDNFDAVMSCKAEDLPKHNDPEVTMQGPKIAKAPVVKRELDNSGSDARMRMEEFMETRFDY